VKDMVRSQMNCNKFTALLMRKLIHIDSFVSNCALIAHWRLLMVANSAHFSYLRLLMVATMQLMRYHHNSGSGATAPTNTIHFISLPLLWPPPLNFKL